MFQIAGVFSLPLTGWFTTNKKQRVYGILVGMLFFGMILSACTSGTPTGTPPVVPCPEPDTNKPIVPTETPAPPTQIPWLSVITDPNALNSNWTDISGGVYLGQNDYNWAFATASNQYNVPAWVLKAIAAHESSFNPSATNDLKAVGLNGLTGNGVSFVLENIDPNDSYFNNKVGNIYNWVMGVYPGTPEIYRLRSNETYISWYMRMRNLTQPTGQCGSLESDLACHLAYQTRNKFVESIDGRDVTQGQVALPPGDALNAEILENVTFSAAHLQLAQREAERMTGSSYWQGLEERDRLLLALAVYNTGESSAAANIIQSVASQNTQPNWATVSKLLIDAGLSGTVTYAEEIFAHADQGGK